MKEARQPNKADKVKGYERLKTALEEIASGKHDMNKLIGIAIKALAEDENDK